MAILQKARRALKRLILGGVSVPEEFSTGIEDPQTEISVWLHGMGTPIDVTFRHSTACSDPFILCIAFDSDRMPGPDEVNQLSLRYRDNQASTGFLGEIELRRTDVIAIGEATLCFFEPRSATNHCLPLSTRYAHYFFHLYRQWNRPDTSPMKMTFLQRRAAMVSFIRPHPTVLVSAEDELGGNLFPMNIMGNLGDGYFGFALRDDREASHLIARTRRLVLSNVPMEYASLPYALAGNHKRSSICWDDVPFETIRSTLFGIPRPAFAQRVRELEVQHVRRIGSHIFHIARILHDEVIFPAPSLCVIHGYYQRYRLRGRGHGLAASLLEDRQNKRGADELEFDISE